MQNSLSLDNDYLSFLTDIKTQVRQARVRAALAANTEVIQMYWHIGRGILERQKNSNWGSKLLEQLSLDLRNTFPEMQGFSERNLKFMRQFAESYPSQDLIGKQLVSQLPWGHIVTLMQRVKNPTTRDWYTNKTIENGWSRAVLSIQIESNLYERQGKLSHKISNYASRLPSPQSDLAENILKDPYVFDFLSTGDTAKEREIERDLTSHITQFLLELGKGFAYVGKQYPISVGGKDFFIDLLFYHLELRCYVVLELKANDFAPADAGQLNFYLSVLDDILKKPEDNPSIGILICKNKNKTVAEYALKDMNKPIGISAYQLTESLPKDLGKNLPSVKELEAELDQVF